MQATTDPIASRPPTTRSRVSNGSTFDPSKVDGRSAPARRYRDLLDELVRDLGGDPSGAQSAIARRAAALCVACEMAEADLVAGKPIDISEFTTAANSLRRLLCDLGLERRSKDVTPSILDYLKSGAA